MRLVYSYEWWGALTGQLHFPLCFCCNFCNTIAERFVLEQITVALKHLLCRCWICQHNSAGSPDRMTNWQYWFACSSITDDTGDSCSHVLVVVFSSLKVCIFKIIITDGHGLSYFKVYSRLGGGKAALFWHSEHIIYGPQYSSVLGTSVNCLVKDFSSRDDPNTGHRDMKEGCGKNMNTLKQKRGNYGKCMHTK